MEVIEGAPPAEYGGKTSVVMVVTTRSGLGATEPHGDVTGSYGSFGTSSGGFDLVDGGKNWGNFISINGSNTGRFLDGPEWTVMHDHGNEENFFDRVDFKFSPLDSVNLNLGFTRSWFQVPNSFDAQNATAWNGLTVNNGGLGPNGQPAGSEDQRAKIQSLNIAGMDPPDRLRHCIYVRRLRPAGCVQLLPEPRPVRRLHARSAASNGRSESIADECRRAHESNLCQGHSQP